MVRPTVIARSQVRGCVIEVKNGESWERWLKLSDHLVIEQCRDFFEQEQEKNPDETLRLVEYVVETIETMEVLEP